MAERPEKCRGTEQAESRCPGVERLLGSHFEGVEVPPRRPLIVWALNHHSGTVPLEMYQAGFPRGKGWRVPSGLSLRPEDLLWRIQRCLVPREIPRERAAECVRIGPWGEVFGMEMSIFRFI